jgi:hypothetical protein
MDDKKKILTQNAMLETYNFVNKIYWVSVVGVLSILCTTLILSQTETTHIKIAILHAESAGAILLLMVLSVARSTTALKVLIIMASTFFGGICLCTISLLDFF